MRRSIHIMSLWLMLMLATLLLSSRAQGQQVYEAKFVAKLPGNNPLSWEQRQRVGGLKDLAVDSRMVKYGVEAASQLTNDSVQRTLDKREAPDPARPTSFMAAYDAKGCYIYFRCDDPDIAKAVATGRGQTLEIFLAPDAPGDTGYFRIDVNIVTGQWYATNYQGNARGDAPLQRAMEVRTEILPDGQAWGTVLFIPWDYFHHQLPFDGQAWAFTFMRWSPTGGVTWGGRVHEHGAWGRIEWQPPTQQQKRAIQAKVIQDAWRTYQDQAVAAQRYWQAAENDPAFYTQQVQPLVERHKALAPQVKDIAKLDEAQVAELYAHVADWVRFPQQVMALRRAYLTSRLMQPVERE